MAITREMQNMSAETPDSVNIARFNPAWTKVDVDTNSRPNAVISSTECRQAGEEPDYPLIRITESRKARIYYPEHSSQAMPGRRFSTVVHSPVKVTDSVSGLTTFVPHYFQVVMGYGGSVLLLPDDSLQMMLSVVGSFWSSVTTGVPDSGLMNKIALGSTEI